MNARELNEAQLVGYRHDFVRQLGLELLAEEVCFGAFRFDALAIDEGDNLAVVEFKTEAAKETLHQLLIYPHVIQGCLAKGGLPGPSVRSILITTHLDTNVVEVVSQLQPIRPITLKVCVGDTETGLKLVDPVEGSNQVWDQAKAGRRWQISAEGGVLKVNDRIVERLKR